MMSTMVGEPMFSGTKWKIVQCVVRPGTDCVRAGLTAGNEPCTAPRMRPGRVGF